MDQQGIIQAHSCLKLELYRCYLESYLSVLLAAGFHKTIHVHDIFAGCGISQDKKQGSAVIAAKIIDEINQQHPDKPISLYLNDFNTSNYDLLGKHTAGIDNVTTTNKTADQYIQDLPDNAGRFQLFFIDPFGYTQLSSDCLELLCKKKKSDFLIFIPIYHIYRFLKTSGAELSHLKSVAKFLHLFGINTDNIKQVKLEDFSERIVAALKTKFCTKFAYWQALDNKQHNSKYGLFFVTRHILAAEKFLEARQKAKKAIPQLEFPFTTEKQLEQFIKYNHPYNNTELYSLGIENEILPSALNKQLQKLEQEKKIEVEVLPGEKRHGKSFYTNYQNYKKPPKISVQFLK